MPKQNQNTKSSQNVCQTLKKALNFTPFRRFHRVSNPHQQSHFAPTPPPQTTNNLTKAYVPQPSPVHLIPIDTAVQGGGQLIKPKVGKHMFPKKQTGTHDPNNDNGGVEGSNNGRFSEYISRVRNGMRTSSDLGIEKIPTKKIPRRDSLNDRVSNFLNRARIKTTASSNVGHNNMHGNAND